MEVLQACRLGDGRLVVLAVGVCRLRVARETQALPYSRADVELLPDGEEREAMEPLALQVGKSGGGGMLCMLGRAHGGAGPAGGPAGEGARAVPSGAGARGPEAAGPGGRACVSLPPTPAHPPHNKGACPSASCPAAANGGCRSAV